MFFSLNFLFCPLVRKLYVLWSNLAKQKTLVRTEENFSGKSQMLHIHHVYVYTWCQIIAFRARKEIEAKNLHNYSLMFLQCPRISLTQGLSIFYQQNTSLLLNISLLENIPQVESLNYKISLYFRIPLYSQLITTISVLFISYVHFVDWQKM